MPDPKETKTNVIPAEDSEQLAFSVEETVPPPAVDWRTQVPSVSQLTRRLRGHIENSFFDVWVRGEISNLRKPVSGHAYFILKDATAQLKGCMFRPVLSKIKFELKDGMEILIHGKISVYEARGEYQIVGDALEPVGVGALQLAFQQLKEKLYKEGLFDPKHKKPLPALPKRIGVVTSATGAAIRDILKVLSRRFPNVHVLVIPASVQGEKAAPEIVNGIQTAEKWNQVNPDRPIETLIVGRGGGSLEDLWPFNEEIVARAIYSCPIPIISAVGHEIDTVISDYVADLRAPTPSAAAEIVLPRKEDLIQTITLLKDRLQRGVRKRVEQFRLHVGHLAERLVDPKEKILKFKESFGVLVLRATQAIQNSIRLRRAYVQKEAQRLNALSPLAVIGRGYSLTRSENGTLVRGIGQTQKDALLRTRVCDGEIISRVLSTEPG